ncbi:MAG TPA: helix-turn-helix transcriptional regulator [Actinomycetota bacterium]|nr:helix-turn-helix transcriptional regulator [Actinomycetota bacterium]
MALPPIKGGQFVREARRRAGLSQRELASRAGTKQSSIARIERNRSSPSLQRVVELVRACGLDLEIHVVPLDEDAWTLAEQTLRLTPDERVRRMMATLRLQQAMERVKDE